jgi:hypothetical protein
VIDEDLIFRRGSFCAVGTCVEVATTTDGGAVLRHSKDWEVVLRFDRDEWTAFRRAVAAGEFGPVD